MLQHAATPRALLLSSSKDIPLIWKALGNKYQDSISFGVLQDKSGKQAVKLGAEDTPTKDSKVLIYPQGSQNYVRYEGTDMSFARNGLSITVRPIGTLKYKPLNKYLGSVADGTADFPIEKEGNGRSSEASENQASSRVVFGNATPSESATLSTVASVSSVPTPHVEQDSETEAAPKREGTDEEDGGAEGTMEPETSSAPQTTATTDPGAGEGARSDHSRDEL